MMMLLVPIIWMYFKPYFVWLSYVCSLQSKGFKHITFYNTSLIWLGILMLLNGYSKFFHFEFILNSITKKHVFFIFYFFMWSWFFKVNMQGTTNIVSLSPPSSHGARQYSNIPKFEFIAYLNIQLVNSKWIYQFLLVFISFIQIIYHCQWLGGASWNHYYYFVIIWKQWWHMYNGTSCVKDLCVVNCQWSVCSHPHHHFHKPPKSMIPIVQLWERREVTLVSLCLLDCNWTQFALELNRKRN